MDVSTLDPDKAYIQITYVEPFFEVYELRHRETYFERNFNMSKLFELTRMLRILSDFVHFIHISNRALYLLNTLHEEWQSTRGTTRTV